MNAGKLRKAIALIGLLLGIYSIQATAQLAQFPKTEFPLTDTGNSAVEFSEILSGGPPRDGIPAIDSPRFVTIDEAGEWLEDAEPVISVQYGEQARAYPLQILMFHEIVNDTFADADIAVTFCPLCNASIVFNRVVGEGESRKVLDFGTTGRLRKSDLVMYDRQTETWWQQFSGKGIIGEYTHSVLTQLPSQIVSFKTFRDAFPDAEVLSKETGFTRAYGKNPYRGYDDINSNPFLFDGEIDPRLPAMERVLSVSIDEKIYLLPLSSLADKPILNLDLGDRSVAIIAAGSASSALDKEYIAQSRQIPAAAAFDPSHGDKILNFQMQDDKIVDEQTESSWNVFGMAIDGELAGIQLKQIDTGVHFAFAWLAFDPDAQVVSVE